MRQTTGTVTTGDCMMVGGNNVAKSLGSYIIDAGSLQVSQGASLGWGHATSAGTITQNGGTVTIGGQGLQFGIQGGSGTYVLNGGTLDSYFGNLATTGSFTFGGGTLKLAGGFTTQSGVATSIAGGATTLAAGATYAYEIDSTNPGSPGAAADLLVVSGNLTLDPADGSLLTFTDLNGTPNSFVSDATVFALINDTGTWNGGRFTYGGSVLPDGGAFVAGGQAWQIDYDDVYDTASPATIRPLNFQADYLPSSGTQTFVAVTAVPEPGTVILAAIGAGLAAFAIRRRRAG